MTGRIFYWNKATFDKAGISVPKSLAELKAAGETFKTKLGEEYYPLVLGEYDRMILMVYYLESVYGKAWVENEKLQYSAEEIQEGLKFIQSLEDAHVTPSIKTGSIIKSAAIILLIPYAVTLLYVFALQARFINPIAKTLKFSLMAAGKFYKYTLKMILIVVVFIALNSTIVLANFITLSMGVGIVVYLLSFYYNKIFSKIILRTEEREEP